MDKQPNCKQRWAAHKDDRCSDLSKLWKAYCAGNEDGVPDLGNFYEYGLSFDYVAPKTFNNQREGYWRYQISWGGPSEEFRFYSSGPHEEPHRITFCFMDWFDGYERKLTGRDEELMSEIWRFFDEVGSTESEQEKAAA